MNAYGVSRGLEFSVIRVPGFAPAHGHGFIVRGGSHAVLFRQAPLPREDLCRAVGLEGAVLHLARQVHGAAVAEFPTPEAAISRNERPEADALITHLAGHAVGVATADCVPILLAARDGRCAAVHAGWRGLLSGVIEAAVRRLREGGAPSLGSDVLAGGAPGDGERGGRAETERGPDRSGSHTSLPSFAGRRLDSATSPGGSRDHRRPGRETQAPRSRRTSESSPGSSESSRGTEPPDLGLEAAIGPAIGPCCFEVGPEVAERFLARFPGVGGFLRPAPATGKSLVDLASAAVLVLEESGVARSNVRLTGLCTRCGPEELESYRRDGEKSGRMIALIGPRQSRS